MDMDKLMATQPLSLLGKWITDSRQQSVAVQLLYYCAHAIFFFPRRSEGETRLMRRDLPPQGIIMDMDKLMATQPLSLLGKWITDARAWGEDEVYPRSRFRASSAHTRHTERIRDIPDSRHILDSHIPGSP